MPAFARSNPGPGSDWKASRAGDTSSQDGDDSKGDSGSLGGAYRYSRLPEHGRIRLLRLMPHSDREAPIICQLFEYPLEQPGQRTHLYEALSYAWGSEENKQPIYIQSDGKAERSAATEPSGTGKNRRLLVTVNLHGALSQLRDPLLERVIWIDAVCINQADDDEKGRQVQSMAKIYANASCVIVWLGEATDDSDQAFEALRRAARAAGGRRALPAIDEPTQQAIHALLERPWFQRIWVLQEIGAARCSLITCGASTIDGFAFSIAVDLSEPLTNHRPALWDLIRPMTSLMRDAATRPVYTTTSPRPFSLNIRPLGELVDMFHTRKATNPLDKIYALFGLSSDDPSSSGLLADYTTSWAEALRKLIQFSTSGLASVESWDEQAVAVIRCKGHILGKISSVNARGREEEQRVGIVWKNPDGFFDEEPENLTLPASAKIIRQGDVVIRLEGASRSTIIRMHHGYSEMIMAATLECADSKLSVPLPRITWLDFLLVWDWEASEIKSQHRDYEPFLKRTKDLCQPRAKLEATMDEVAKLWDFGTILNGIERYEDADRYLRQAVEEYATAYKSINNSPDLEALKMLDDRPHKEALRVIDGIAHSANYDTSFDTHTPLLWALKNGHDEGVKLLLSKGLGFRKEDYLKFKTPLHWAVSEGYEAAAKTVLDHGAAIETRDSVGLTPLLRATENGHENVVKLLLDRGAVIEAPFRERNPLLLAAEDGHENIVKLLLDHGAAIEALDNFPKRTPLLLAAENGHKNVVKLLVDRGAAIEAQAFLEQTPLWVAAEHGHENILKLLLDRGAAIESKSSIGKTPLHQAVLWQRTCVVKLLLDRGAMVEAEDTRGRTPLSSAEKCGNKDIVELLRKFRRRGRWRIFR